MSRDELLLYYERELRFIRKLATGFAEKYPEVARKYLQGMGGGQFLFRMGDPDTGVFTTPRAFKLFQDGKPRVRLLQPFDRPEATDEGKPTDEGKEGDRKSVV